MDFRTTPSLINICDLRFNFIMAPPIIILSTLWGCFSAKFRIKMVPREIPIKWDFSIFSKLITSNISSVILSKVYLSLKASFRCNLEFPCPLRSNRSTLKCFLNSLSCLYQIVELPPAPCTKTTHLSEVLCLCVL